MLAFPNAKINLGLHVLEKRADGFHNIETVFYPIKWCDVLEIIPESKTGKNIPKFNSSGIKIIVRKEKNLCVRAYNLLKEEYSISSIQMHLHKLVPVGAGLGGGSSDATHTLLLLNKVFSLNLKENELTQYASTLGSDCAFFLHNKTVLAREKGNVFEEINLSLKNYFIVVVKPDVHVSTADAYENVKPARPEISLKEVISKPISEWKKSLVNDFEKSVFKKYPEIKYLKEELYNAGAIYASLSGSGSAVYGLFENEFELKNQFKEFEVWSGKLD